MREEQGMERSGKRAEWKGKEGGTERMISERQGACHSHVQYSESPKLT
jgi:hypothetical protein